MTCPPRGPECGSEDRKKRGRLVRRRLAHGEDDGRDHHGQQRVFLGRSTTRDSFAHSVHEALGRFLEDRSTLPRCESSERVLFKDRGREVCVEACEVGYSLAYLGLGSREGFLEPNGLVECSPG